MANSIASATSFTIGAEIRKENVTPSGTLCVNMKWGQLTDLFTEGMKDFNHGSELTRSRSRGSCESNAQTLHRRG